MLTVTGTEFATQAQSDRYTGVPYSKLDCQAFVEEVLKDCGVRKPDGSIYNCKGSNSMWRNALRWKGTIEECKRLFNGIPLGSWVFIVKDDGGEVDRGYHDNEGNASHVGIYCRNSEKPVRDSTKTATRNGVGYRELAGFTHVGLLSMITYTGTTAKQKAVRAVSIVRDPDSSDEECLNALEILTKYMRGV